MESDRKTDFPKDGTCEKTGACRLLALDFGDKTVGVAASDELGMMAHGVETIRRSRPTKLRRTLSRIEEIASERGTEQIVLGLPLFPDGSEGIRCEKTRAFGELLQKRLRLSVVYQDERLSTVEAYERMKASGKSLEEGQKRVDEVSAVIILEDYLAGQK